MKFMTSTVLAAALLAGSLLANAQNQTNNNYDRQALPNSVAAPAAVGSDDGFHPMIGTPAMHQDDAARQDDRSKQQEHRLAPDDPKKNPYWEPKDFNYIEEQIGG